jgi:hypothetical protein
MRGMCHRLSGSGIDVKGRVPFSFSKNPQAHHDLPQAPDLQKQWKRVGLDNNDPKYGRWVEGGSQGDHQKWSYAFNQEWRNFFDQYPEATEDQILQQMNKLRNDPRFQ